MEIFFYFFASIALISSIMVIASTSSIHSVMWLIMTFCGAAGLMILIGAEFMAIIYIIVYVGAVMMLFLFVIMMIDRRKNAAKTQNSTISRYLVFILCFAVILQIAMIIILGAERQNIGIMGAPEKIIMISDIAKTMYSDFILEFQICGLILLAAMISSISLAQYRKRNIKKYSHYKAMQRSKENSISLVKTGFKEKLQNLDYD